MASNGEMEMSGVGTGHAGAGAADRESGRPQERPHPGAGRYLQVAAILTVVTALEVAVYYVSSLRGALLGILLVLSAIKFVLVAMFYMHLKFDSRLFTWLFVFPMIIIGSILVSLMAMQRLLG